MTPSEAREIACREVHPSDAHRHYFTGRHPHDKCQCDPCRACTRVAAAILKAWESGYKVGYESGWNRE